MTTTRRRYTKREKATAISAAMASSTLAAAEKSGIPESTLRYWMHSPEFADLRAKTRDELAEGSMVLAAVTQGEIIRKVRAGEVEPRDLAIIYGIAVEKGQLLAGAATARTETKALTSELDEDAKARLRHILYEASVEDDADGDALGDSVGDRAEEVRQ